MEMVILNDVIVNTTKSIDLSANKLTDPPTITSQPQPEVSFKYPLCLRMCEMSSDSYKCPTDLSTQCDVLSFISEGDAQCYIWKYRDSVAVSFRGTESLGDVKDDMSIVQVHFSLPAGYLEPEGMSIRVHGGFYRQFKILEPKISPILSEHMRDSDKILYFTGHSLGGGLATLASLYYSYKFKNPVSCITFGSPRAGNKDFAETFNGRIAYSSRFVNQEDPIPFVPSDIFYEHVCGIKYIDRMGRIQNSITDNRILCCIKDLICSLCSNAERPSHDHCCSDYLKSIKENNMNI